MSKIQTFIDHLKEKATAEGHAPDGTKAFKSSTLYRVGMKEFGLTCGDVHRTFLGKENKVARGLYRLVETAAIEGGSKPLKAGKRKKTEIETPKPEDFFCDPGEVLPSLDSNDGEQSPGEIFLYIATPEEIAE